MTPVVVDASAALAWILDSQSTQTSRRMIEEADRYRFMAPAIFQFEVLNVLVSFNRRGLLSDGAYAGATGDLDDLELALSPPIPNEELLGLAEFARTAGLSVFDACYAQLALNEDCGLASRDTRLLEACERLGILSFDLRVDAGFQED